MSAPKSRFDGINLGSNASMRRITRATMLRRHDDLRDAVILLRNNDCEHGAVMIESMILTEQREAGI